MSPRVLIVSSDEQALKGAVHTLRTAGFDATGAATFEEGSQTLREFSPRLELSSANYRDNQARLLKKLVPTRRACIIGRVRGGRSGRSTNPRRAFSLESV